jgi:hypothetical protein
MRGQRDERQSLHNRYTLVYAAVTLLTTVIAGVLVEYVKPLLITPDRTGDTRAKAPAELTTPKGAGPPAILPSTTVTSEPPVKATPDGRPVQQAPVKLDQPQGDPRLKNSLQQRPPAVYVGFASRFGLTERHVKIVIEGQELTQRWEAIVRSHLPDDWHIDTLDGAAFPPTEVLNIHVTFEPSPGGNCPVSQAKTATLTYDLETIPPTGGQGIPRGFHVSHGTACFGRTDEETTATALQNALAPPNAVLSLFQELR